MANNFADDLEVDVLNHFLKAGGSGAVAQPANLLLCLFTADPTEAGSLANEVVGGVGYTRQAVSFKAVTTNGTAKRTSNNGPINFPAGTGAGWGTITHFAVVDAAAATPGSAVTKWRITGPLTNAKTVGNGDTFSVADGALTVDVD